MSYAFTYKASTRGLTKRHSALLEALSPYYPHAILPDVPLAYYRLGELAGTAAVDEMGGANGSYNGSFTLGTASLVGDSNASVDLTGGYVSTPDQGVTGDYSLEVWINPDAFPGDMRLVYANGTNWNTRFDSGALQLLNDAGGTWNSFGLHGMIVGQNYQIVITRASGTTRAYINTRLLPSTPSNSANPTDQILFWGRPFNDTFGTPFNGRMDEISVWSRALSIDEIEAHYFAATPRAAG